MQQIVMGLMNENDVVILEGVDLTDQLYLSVPVDTAGIERRYLSPDVLQNYEDSEEIAQQE
jgi:hypothetical protein